MGGVALGQIGTVPFGHTEPLSPLGSCPANPSGPVPDGSQLTDITHDAGLTVFAGSSAPASIFAVALLSEVAATSTEAVPRELSATTTSTAPSTASAELAVDFQLQNALDAQKLNTQFATLSEDDSCNGASHFQYGEPRTSVLTHDV